MKLDEQLETTRKLQTVLISHGYIVIGTQTSHQVNGLVSVIQLGENGALVGPVIVKDSATYEDFFKQREICGLSGNHTRWPYYYKVVAE